MNQFARIKAKMKRTISSLERKLVGRRNIRGILLNRQIFSLGGCLFSTGMHEAELRLLIGGYHFSNKVLAQTYELSPRKVVYLLHNSLPYTSAGYAIRSHGILKSMRAAGWDMVGVTRLGFPHDRGIAVGKDVPETETIDGVPYRRLIEKTRGYGRVPMDEYLRVYADRVEKICQEERAVIVHGASNYLNGLVAAEVGRRLGIPSVYEVRGLWEITRISREPAWKGSEEYDLTVRLESEAMNAADLIICLNDSLRRLLADERGIPSSKINIVPNAVDPASFTHDLNARTITRRIVEAGDRLVVGFIGSIVDYEGVDDLIQAAAHLASRDPDSWLFLIVGDGNFLTECKRMVQRLGVDEIVKFTGRVPHADIANFYAACDVIAIPRKPLPVTETVTALKIFEAFAASRPVVASSVSALSEVIRESQGGVVFDKGDISSLVSKLEMLRENPEARTALGESGRRYTVELRNWEKCGGILSNIYKNLLTGKNTNL